MSLPQGLSQGGSGSFGEGDRQPALRKTKDVLHMFHVTLEDLYNGKTTELAFSRNVICGECNGKGGNEDTFIECSLCNGCGVRVITYQMGPTIQRIRQSCYECKGAGKVLNPKDVCRTCAGRKTVVEKKNLELHIDKGMEGGQKIRFPEQSDQVPGFLPGDVVIDIEEKPHPRFKRKKKDLFTEVEVDLLTALAGGQFSIKHLDDCVLVGTINPGEVIKSGDVKVIHGQGMPSQQHHEPGDLFVHMSVKFPEKIDRNDIPFLELALPPRLGREMPLASMKVVEIELDDVDARQASVRVDEDAKEDEGDRKVQCEHQ